MKRYTEEEVTAATHTFVKAYADTVIEKLRIGILIQRVMNPSDALNLAREMYKEGFHPLDQPYTVGPFFSMSTAEPTWDVTYSLRAYTVKLNFHMEGDGEVKMEIEDKFHKRRAVEELLKPTPA